MDKIGSNNPTGDLRLRPRPSNSHKGTFGHLLVVAGSRGMVGAACLATLAALRSGAGLVTLATPATVQPIAAGRAISAMTVPLPETAGGSIAAGAASELAPYLERATAVAIGPGLTTDAETCAFVRKLLTSLGQRIAVADADALNALAHDPGPAAMPGDVWPRLVLTPHPREFARLTGQPSATILADPDADTGHSRADCRARARPGRRTVRCAAGRNGHDLGRPGGRPGVRVA